MSTSEKFLLTIDKKIGKLLRLGAITVSTALSVPAVGAMFNVMYNGIIGGIEKKNFQIFIEDYVNKNIEEKFDENNQKHVELIKHAVLSSLKCSHEAKIKRIVDILSNSLEKSNLSENEGEDLINIVAELSENEAIIFNEIYKNYSTIDIKEDIRIYVSEVIKIVPKYNDNIEFYMYRLMGKGLLREVDMILRGGQKIYNLTSMGYQLFNTFHGDKK